MKLCKNLTLRELCELIFKNQDKRLSIFNIDCETDIDKNIEKSKNTYFDFVVYQYDYEDLVENVAIKIKNKTKSLPLWLIESNAWALRIEEVE